MTRTTVFYRQLHERIRALGGMCNAHLHLDRAGTLAEQYWRGSEVDVRSISAVALLDKHAMIRTLHGGPAYRPESLTERVDEYLDAMVEVGTTRADTFVDVTADGVGRTAFATLQAIKRRRAHEIDLRLGAYSPLGYRDDEPERWQLLVAAARDADFVGSLPEADDRHDHPAHIGFAENCRRMLVLAAELGKELHVHLDQRNEPSENGTEQLLDAIREVGAPANPDGTPAVWAVHVISPSTYDEPRFQRLLAGLVECRVGVICSPSAALGMRQLRPIVGPTYNSIARVLEMLAAGVHVRLGSDNMADICSPSTTADLVDEVFVLSAALRFYDVDVLARLAAGQPLSAAERALVQRHNERNTAEIERTLAALRRRR